MKQSLIRARENLKPYCGKIVSCSGRIGTDRRHPNRRDLDTICLESVIITPDEGSSVFLDHLWVLKRQLRRAKVSLTPGDRVRFRAKVYRYRRRGGNSAIRGLLNQSDYGLSPQDPSHENCNHK